jgi:putative membrane protein
MNLLFKLFISSVSVLLAAELLPGIHIDGFLTAVFVAIIIAILNVFLKPLLIILTIPISILTLGLFLLVINTLIVLITSQIINGFLVDSFWWALLFSILVSIISSLLGINQKKKSKYEE